MIIERFSRLIGLFIVIAAVLTFSTCGLLMNMNDGNNIKIISHNTNILPGMTAQFSLLLYNNGRFVMDVTDSASWSSSNPAVAAVVGKGTFAAIISGSVAVGTQYNDLYENIMLDVIEINPTPTPAAGLVQFVPSWLTVDVGAPFSTEIHVNTGTQRLGSYSFNISYDPGMLMLESGNPVNTISPDGFMDSLPTMTPGNLMVTGLNPAGSGPSSDLALIQINWKLIGGSTGQNIRINIYVNYLRDTDSSCIGFPSGFNMMVIVKNAPPPPPLGEVWLKPGTISVQPYTYFMTEVHLNVKGALPFKRYDFILNFDPIYFSYMMVENTGTESESFANNYSISTGSLRVWGEHSSGIIPTGPDILFMRIQWRSNAVPGPSTIAFNPVFLEDTNYAPIGSPHGTGASIDVVAAGGPKLKIYCNSAFLDSGMTQNFGNVPTFVDGGDMSPTYAFVIKNEGDASLHISSITFPSVDFDIQNTPPCTLDVPIGGNIPFGIIFDPQSAGPKLSDLTIMSNDVSKPSYTVHLTGNQS